MESQPTCCPNCGNGDPAAFQFNTEFGNTTCTVCALILDDWGESEYYGLYAQAEAVDGSYVVQDIVTVDGSSTQLLVDTIVPSTVLHDSGQPGSTNPNNKKRAKMYSYRRGAYICENGRQAMCTEPQIPPEVLEQIKRYHRDVYTKSNTFRAELARKGRIRKSDVQCILRALDAQREREGVVVRRTMKYTTRYLERWKSIVVALGGKVKVYSPDDLVRVCSELKFYSDKWDLYQPVHHEKDRSTWIFRNRKDFPHLGFMIRHINKKFGLAEMNTEFPIPKTLSARKNLQGYLDWLDGVPRTRYSQTTLPDAKGSVIRKRDPDVEILSGPPEKKQKTISSFFSK